MTKVTITEWTGGRKPGGWQWTVTRSDGHTEKYRTDSNFEGLWMWQTGNGGPCWNQLRGHMQFNLSPVKANARRKLARMYRN